MNKQLLTEVWSNLAGQRIEMVEAFYRNLFARYPQYEEFFPTNIDHQMDLMVEVMSTVINFSDQINIIRPYLVRVGVAHRHYSLTPQDFRNFSQVFIDTLGEVCGDQWQAQHQQAFEETFDDVILPLIEEGLH